MSCGLDRKQITFETALPVGVMMFYGSTSVPSGWLECNGQAISRTTYAALFAVIGTTFGVGDGSTTFNIPDLRGRTLQGDGTGDASDATAHTIADKDGTEKHALSVAELASHSHGHTHGSGGADGFVEQNGVGAEGFGGGGNAYVVSSTTQSDATTAGSGTAHNNIQPTLTAVGIIFAGA